MRFGPLPTDQAQGMILAHSHMVARGKIAKGSILTAEDIAALAASGLAQVTVAQPEPGDVLENPASSALAHALGPDAAMTMTKPFTGRVNLHAAANGVLVLDAGRIHALNRIDPAITLATLMPFARVSPGMLVGTVKIISYAVAGAALAQAVAQAAGAMRVQPVVARDAGLILTEVPGQAARLNDKAIRVTAQRLSGLGMRLAETRVVPHGSGPIAEAVAGIAGDMVLMLTGSATSDLRDTGPEGLRQAGGTVARFGIPVDPGNLLFHGRLGARPVIGLPGCARSPALNGADWLLERLACGMTPTDEDIAAMGIGGLLKEIPTRPQPREPGLQGR